MKSFWLKRSQILCCDDRYGFCGTFPVTMVFTTLTDESFILSSLYHLEKRSPEIPSTGSRRKVCVLALPFARARCSLLKQERSMVQQRKKRSNPWPCHLVQFWEWSYEFGRVECRGRWLPQPKSSSYQMKNQCLCCQHRIYLGFTWHLRVLSNSARWFVPCGTQLGTWLDCSMEQEHSVRGG